MRAKEEMTTDVIHPLEEITDDLLIVDMTIAIEVEMRNTHPDIDVLDLPDIDLIAIEAIPVITTEDDLETTNAGDMTMMIIVEIDHPAELPQSPKKPRIKVLMVQSRKNTLLSWNW